MEMSSARIAVAIIAIVLSSVAGLSANVLFQQIVKAVNLRLPREQQFDPLWWHWPKRRRLMTEYRRQYPDRALEIKYRILVAAAFVSIFAAVWAIGFFR
jgi:hypothetical protein